MKTIETIIEREIGKLKENFTIKLAERVRHLIITNYDRHDDFRKYYLGQIEYIQDLNLKRYRH